MNLDEEYIPQLLSKEERDNPYLLLEIFFSVYPLPELREIVWEHSQVILSSKQIKKLKPEDILLFYENIEKLFEAAHLLKRRYDSLKELNWSGKRYTDKKWF